jgi:NAD(P)H dehydrogenase (quinone)
MNVLLVYAHPEPQSFNGAMRDLAIDVLTRDRHTVVLSDLYAMNFNAIGGPHDFQDLQDTTFFKYQREQRHATATRTFAPDVAREMEKLIRADMLLLQFPLWWYSLPAILKGWIDRVFAMGFAYDAGRAHESGPIQGKRAMVAVTTGGPSTSFGVGAFSPPIDDVLFHIQYGMLHFAGMQVLPPFIAYGAARIDDAQRAALLDRFGEHLQALETLQPLDFSHRARQAHRT